MGSFSNYCQAGNKLLIFFGAGEHCQNIILVRLCLGKLQWSRVLIKARGRTYVMITYVSKQNNLGPGDTIRYIWGLKGPIFVL